MHVSTGLEVESVALMAFADVLLLRDGIEAVAGRTAFEEVHVGECIFAIRPALLPVTMCRYWALACVRAPY